MIGAEMLSDLEQAEVSVSDTHREIAQAALWWYRIVAQGGTGV
jgi:hypothetical protein